MKNNKFVSETMNPSFLIERNKALVCHETRTKNKENATRIQYQSYGPHVAFNRGRWFPPTEAEKMETHVAEITEKMNDLGWGYWVYYDNSRPYNEKRAKEGWMDD